MTDDSAVRAGFGETDIIFECPGCGKSLGIDERGAGLLVRCPDCGLRLQVPVPPETDESELRPGNTVVSDYTNVDLARLGAASEGVARVSYSDDDVHDRKRHLEKIRIDYLARFERILEEMALIQASLDRMTDLLQDMKAPPASD